LKSGGKGGLTILFGRGKCLGNMGTGINGVIKYMQFGKAGLWPTTMGVLRRRHTTVQLQKPGSFGLFLGRIFREMSGSKNRDQKGLI